MDDFRYLITNIAIIASIVILFIIYVKIYKDAYKMNDEQLINRYLFLVALRKKKQKK